MSLCNDVTMHLYIFLAMSSTTFANMQNNVAWDVEFGIILQFALYLYMHGTKQFSGALNKDIAIFVDSMYAKHV